MASVKVYPVFTLGDEPAGQPIRNRGARRRTRTYLPQCTAAGMIAATARAGQRGGVMRLAISIRPAPSSLTRAGRGEQTSAVALSPDGHAVAVWGSAVGCPAACDYIVQAAVRSPGGSWGAPVTLTTDLYFGGGGIVLGMDGSGNAIAAWVGNYADASHYAVLPAGGSWGPVRELSNGNVQGAAHGLDLAV